MRYIGLKAITRICFLIIRYEKNIITCRCGIVDDSMDFYKNIVLDSDLEDLRYLYWYGLNVTENEIKIAKFLNSRSDKEIQDMADTCTEGFVRGFELGRKDLSKKNTVNIYYAIGFERVVRKVIDNLDKLGLKAIIRQSGVSTTDANKQYQFDHKFDQGLYLDKGLIDRKLTVAKVSFEKYKDRYRDFWRKTIYTCGKGYGS